MCFNTIHVYVQMLEIIAVPSSLFAVTVAFRRSASSRVTSIPKKSKKCTFKTLAC